MARFLIPLFAIVVSMLAYQTQATGSKDDHTKDAAYFAEQESTKLQNSPPVAVQEQAAHSKPSEQESQNQKLKNSDPPHDWVDYANACSTLTIAAFTVLLFIAVVWQTRTTRNIERAWVVGSLEWFENVKIRMQERISQLPAGNFVDLTTITLKLTCKNCGRGLARIDGIYGRVDIASRASPDRPDESDLSDLGPMEAIAPGAEAHRGLLMHCQGQWKADQFLCVYVLIRYSDIFGEHRETSMGYVIDWDLNVYLQEALKSRNTNT